MQVLAGLSRNLSQRASTAFSHRIELVFELEESRLHRRDSPLMQALAIPLFRAVLLLSMRSPCSCTAWGQHLAADFGFCPHPISSRWLFTETRNSVSVDRDQRSFSDWPFLIKLDVWELVRPRDNSWPIITSKAQRRGSRALAVRQAALFTYELLCGEKKRKGAVKGWFKPVNSLETPVTQFFTVASKARRCLRVANVSFTS